MFHSCNINVYSSSSVVYFKQYSGSSFSKNGLWSESCRTMSLKSDADTAAMVPFTGVLSECHFFTIQFWNKGFSCFKYQGGIGKKGRENCYELRRYYFGDFKESYIFIKSSPEAYYFGDIKESHIFYKKLTRGLEVSRLYYFAEGERYDGHEKNPQATNLTHRIRPK